MLGSLGARVLRSTDRDAVLDVLSRDRVESVLVGSRINDGRIDRRSIGGALWGYGDAGELTSVCFSGANLIPLQADADAARAYAELAIDEGRRCSSIVGRRDTVQLMWDYLEPHWGTARLIRRLQPMMTIERPARTEADPLVRPATRLDFDALLPAAIAMYVEEIGISPMWHDGGTAYRLRVLELIDRRRCFVRVDDGEVVFKAELGAVTPYCAQIQGVWVHPRRRGEGLGAAGTAAVVEATLARGYPVVSLYVNEFNHPALAAYERVGFTIVDEFMSVLF